MRLAVFFSTLRARSAFEIPSIRRWWWLDSAPICATRLATLAKIVAFTVEPSSTTAMVKSVSHSSVGAVLSPMIIISVE